MFTKYYIAQCLNCKATFAIPLDSVDATAVGDFNDSCCGDSDMNWMYSNNGNRPMDMIRQVVVPLRDGLLTPML